MTFNIDKYLEKAYKCELLDQLVIKVVTKKCIELFIKEENVRHVSGPISCVGDIHGQFFDLLELFKVGGKPPLASYIFLGDFVDRGDHSVETITLLCLLKLKYPHLITMIRGNHETRTVSQTYGFYVECQKKFGTLDCWEYFNEMFDFLPLAAVVDDQVFCVHGGLSPSIEYLSDIGEINRFQEIPQEGAFIDLMWSDPNPTGTGFSNSERGAGYMFGSDIVNKFLHLNGLEKIVRAHQICKEGYKLYFDDKLATVWSAPNYCYRFKNLASVLEIDEDLGFEFNIFSWAPESDRGSLGTQLKDLDRLSDFFM